MGQGEDVELWPIYDAVRCPTLVLRGAQSDLLSAADGGGDGANAGRGRGWWRSPVSAMRRC